MRSALNRGKSFYMPSMPNLIAQANVEKQRLEQKQRAARKAADRGEPIRPRWFRPVPGAVPGEQQAYVYSGGYWCAPLCGMSESACHAWAGATCLQALVACWPALKTCSALRFYEGS